MSQNKKVPRVNNNVRVNNNEFYFNDSKKNKITEDYEILQKLGVGSFGFVKKGKNTKTGELVAIKSCLKGKCQVGVLVQEVELLKIVQGCEGIVRLIDVYESKKKVNIVMEYIRGGELFDKIVELESYSEKDAAGLVKQVVDCVHYCHSKNIVHRDLKPENLMFSDEESTILKLIDFGVSAIVNSQDQLLFDKVGTRTYMAPEVMSGKGYGKPCDLYSIGVITYILLAGYPPFDEEEGITELDFPSPDWDGISQEVIKLIRNLLSDDPKERITIEELKFHPWVCGEETSDISLKKKGTITSLRQFNTLRKMGATMNAGRSNKRVSIFGMFDLQEEKQQIRKARGSLCLSDEDLMKRIDEQLKDISDLFQILNQDLMDFSLRSKENEKKKYILKTAEELDLMNTAFNDLKKDISTNFDVKE